LSVFRITQGSVATLVLRCGGWNSYWYIRLWLL